jgi:outer membrane protein W
MAVPAFTGLFLARSAGMKTLCLLLLAAVIAPTALAQRTLELIVDAEGVRRTGKTRSEIGVQELRPTFGTGWGIGGGLNLWLSDRVSVEGKVAGFLSRLNVQTRGSDFVVNAQLGHAQIYPLMAVVQWHPVEHGAMRPYIGIGAAHVILRNVKEQIGSSGASGIRFHDPTGLLLDAGLRIAMSKRWSLSGDVRYVPVETRGRTELTGTAASARFEMKPLIVGFGTAYRF